MSFTQKDTDRLDVLDVFRGITMFMMIVVNTPGGGAQPYAQVIHAEWNGFTLADLVFPSFLFAMGSSMVFSLKKYTGQSFLLKISLRTVKIFLAGCFLNWFVTAVWTTKGIHFTNPADIRIMGVLQRLALCYLVAAILIKYISITKLVVLSGILLIGYHLILYSFSPGHSQSISDNAVRSLDLWIFNEINLYHEQGIIFDPEGILSTLPSLVNVLAGYFAVKIIQQYEKTYETVARLLIIGNSLILAGLFWHTLLPLNKKLWTSSFALLCTGIDFSIMAVLFFMIDIKKIKTGNRFFNIFGRNPLFIYVLSTMSGLILILPITVDYNLSDWINLYFFQELMPGSLGSLFFSLAFTMVFWIIARILDRNKIYIKL